MVDIHIVIIFSCQNDIGQSRICIVILAILQQRFFFCQEEIMVEFVGFFFPVKYEVCTNF